MRKIRLDVDRLTVESFDTAREREEHGTILGHAATRLSLCCTAETGCNSCSCSFVETCVCHCGANA